MKRSRIFLGITACLLAIAGVGATKAYRFHEIIAYYYTNVNFVSIHACVQFPHNVNCWYNNGFQGCVTFLPKPGGGVSTYQLYYSGNAFLGCRTPLYVNDQ